MMMKVIRAVIEMSYKQYHTGPNRCSPQERHLEQVMNINALIDLVQRHCRDEATRYCDARDEKTQGELTLIQNLVVRVLGLIFDGTAEIMPASSFTGGIHLRSSSDLDILVMVPSLGEKTRIAVGAKLEALGYEFVEVRRLDDPAQCHWVYRRFVPLGVGDDSVEVEIKVRDADGFRPFLGMHDWLDRRMTAEQRSSLTWLKQSVKGSPDDYKKLKEMIYCWSAWYGGVDQLIYRV